LLELFSLSEEHETTETGELFGGEGRNNNLFFSLLLLYPSILLFALPQ
jgi:hypothetical protein